MLLIALMLAYAWTRRIFAAPPLTRGGREGFKG